MRTNVGNVGIEVSTTSVRIRQHVPHSEKLDCHLTFDEARKLGQMLLSLEKSTSVVTDFDDLL